MPLAASTNKTTQTSTAARTPCCPRHRCLRASARRKYRVFLGAGSINEIVFVRGTTEGINLIAQTYGRKFLQPGDEIVLSMLEHHANIVPWQMIAKEKGANLRVIPSMIAVRS